MPRPAGLAATLLALGTAASAQGYQTLSGSVIHLDRMALPPESVVLVEVTGPDLRLEAEARIPTDGAQVPIPFSIEVPDGFEGNLRAGIVLGGTVALLGDPVAIDATGARDLGDIRLDRFSPVGFLAEYRCGEHPVRVGAAGTDLVMEAGGERRRLSPVPAASGARYEAAGDATTYFWSRGEGALVGLAGTELPECRIALPRHETPWRALGNEPFWSVRQADGALVLSWLGFTDLTLPIVDSTFDDAGAIVVTAFDAVQAQRAVLTRAPVICRDTMTGMPHPETVSLTISMPMGGETLTGCGGGPADLLTGRTWVVEDIAGAGLIDGTRVTLGFGTDGRVAGSGGCNRWFAGYDLTGEGLSIGQAGATMMACPEAIMGQERRVFETLAQVTGFDIDETGALVLLASEQPVLLARAATDGSAP